MNTLTLICPGCTREGCSDCHREGSLRFMEPTTLPDVAVRWRGVTVRCGCVSCSASRSGATTEAAA